MTGCTYNGDENVEERIVAFDEFRIDSELIGRWNISDSLPVTLTFTDDGMGTDNESTFAWTIEDDILMMKSIRTGEVEVRSFSYSISNDWLILIGVENGIENDFYRIE